MTPFLRRIASTVQRAPLAVILVVLLLTGVFGWLASQAPAPGGTGVDSFSTDSPAAVTSERIGELFTDAGADQRVAQLVVKQADGDVLDADGVALGATIANDLRTNPAVADVLLVNEMSPGVLTYADLVVGGAAQQGLDPLALDDAAVDAIQAGSLEALGDQAAGIASLLGTPNATATDAEAGMVLIFLNPDASDDALDAAQAAINEQAGSFAEHDVYTFDFEALMADSTEDMTAEMGRLLGLAFALIIGVLILIYRKPVDVIASLLGLLFAIMWSQGLNVLLGPSFLGWTGPASEMAMAIPILLVGLGVDYGIHLTMRAREEGTHGATADESHTRSILAVGSALTLATVTTVVGFGTNITNPLPPLQDFGIFAAVGVIAAFIVMVTFVPALRLIAARRREAKLDISPAPAAPATPVKPGMLGRAAASLAPLAVHHPVRVLVVAGIITAAAGVSATNLSTEFSTTDFFAEGSRALETIEVVNDQFGGGLTEQTQVLLTPAPADDVLAGYLAGLANIENVRSFDGQAQAEPLLSDDGSALLLNVATSAGEFADELVVSLNQLETSILTPNGVEADLTSEAILTDEILVSLKDSQVNGLVVTLIASMLILSLAFGIRNRAPMLGVLSIASVGVVTVWVLGLMALVGIPFNVMTAMVSSLAIGIGVPFGIHVVNRFLEDREAHLDTFNAMRDTLENTGGALVGSAATTVLGFGVLMLASIPPMKQFGLVTAVTIFLALISSLVVLPALLALWARVTDSRAGTPADEPAPANSDKDVLAPAR